MDHSPAPRPASGGSKPELEGGLSTAWMPLEIWIIPQREPKSQLWPDMDFRFIFPQALRPVHFDLEFSLNLPMLLARTTSPLVPLSGPWFFSS